MFEATVLPDNYRMAAVFRESGFAPRIRSKPDLISVEFPTTISEEALERFEERDRTAAVAAISHFLEPRSVAVVGASRERGTVGGEVFHNLLSAGFNGPVFPINPRPTSCSPCRPSSRSGTSPARLSWRSWRCRPRWWSMRPGNAPQRAFGRWW